MAEEAGREWRADLSRFRCVIVCIILGCVAVSTAMLWLGSDRSGGKRSARRLYKDPGRTWPLGEQHPCEVELGPLSEAVQHFTVSALPTRAIVGTVVTVVLQLYTHLGVLYPCCLQSEGAAWPGSIVSRLVSPSAMLPVITHYKGRGSYTISFTPLDAERYVLQLYVSTVCPFERSTVMKARGGWFATVPLHPLSSVLDVHWGPVGAPQYPSRPCRIGTDDLSHGRWLRCGSGQRCPTDGWTWVPKDCRIEVVSGGALSQLGLIGDGIHVVVLGDSVGRGIFWYLFEELFGVRAHLCGAKVHKCWGEVTARQGNLRLTFHDTRFHLGAPPFEATTWTALEESRFVEFLSSLVRGGHTPTHLVVKSPGTSLRSFETIRRFFPGNGSRGEVMWISSTPSIGHGDERRMVQPIDRRLQRRCRQEIHHRFADVFDLASVRLDTMEHQAPNFTHVWTRDLHFHRLDERCHPNGPVNEVMGQLVLGMVVEGVTSHELHTSPTVGPVEMCWSCPDSIQGFTLYETLECQVDDGV